MIGAFHAPAQLFGHGVHAVADAEHGDSELEHRRGHTHVAGFENQFGTAGKNDAFRSEGPPCSRVSIEVASFGVHIGFAHPAGDELGVLGAKIQDQDAVRVNVRMLRV